MGDPFHILMRKDLLRPVFKPLTLRKVNCDTDSIAQCVAL